MKPSSIGISSVYFIGALTLFIGERVVQPGKARWVCLGLGVAMMLGALVLRYVRTLKVDQQRKGVESAFLGLYAIGLAALLMYGAQSDWATHSGGELLEQNSPILAGALAVLWPVVMLCALLPTLLMEMAYAAMSGAQQIETGRVKDALYSGLGSAAVLTFCFSMMYVATERDVKWDLSYFRTGKPSEPTRKLVESLEEPLEVSLFFPPANEVAEQVKTYFDALTPLSPYLKVELLDKDLNPTLARERGVTSNGTVVFSRGKRRETMLMGQDLEKSRTQLRSLDVDAQKRMLSLTRNQKTIYFTQGHGERQKEPIGGVEARASLSLLRRELRNLNYDVRELGLAEGLGNDVPADASVVIVSGPTEAFQEPEMASLRRYFEKGGRLLVALDPEAGLTFEPLLSAFGLKFGAQVLANDVVYGVKTYQPIDRTNLATATFSSHPSVSTNNRLQVPLVFMGAGALEGLPKMPPDVVFDFSVRADSKTWVDLDQNYTFNAPAETRQSYGLVADVTRRADKPEKEGRAIVVGDSDVMGDELLQVSKGNPVFVIDAIKWLLGEESLIGSVTSEEDRPILRTRDMENTFFYSTIFLAPALVVAVGYLASRRRQGAKS